MKERLRRILFGSLRRQLTAGIALVIAATMALFVHDIVKRQREGLLERQEAAAVGLAESLALASAYALGARDTAALQDLVDAHRDAPQVEFVMLLDTRGRVLAHTEARRVGQYLGDLPDRTGTAMLARTPQLVDVATSVMLDKQQVGWSRVGIARGRDTALSQVTQGGIIYALAAILAGTLIASLAAGRLTRRLQAIQRVADGIERGDLGQRARLAGEDETARLGRAFDAMLDSLDASRAARAESERNLRQALDAAAMAAWRWDIVADRLQWGEDPSHLLGPPPAAGYPSFPEMVVDGDRQAFLETGRAAMRQGSEYHAEFRLRRTDGEVRWIMTRGRVLRDAGGAAIAMHGVAQDITENKRLRDELAGHRDHLEELVAARTAELEEAEAWSRLILDSSADGMMGIGVDTNFTFANPTACRLLGYAEEDLIGRPVHATIHHSRQDGTPYPEAACPMLAALREERAIRIDEEVLWRADGSPLPVTYAAQPIRHGGRLAGLVLSFIDMTAQRASDSARMVALAEAERLARIRSLFMASMSHEIRTPLSGVLGMAHIGMRNNAGTPAGEAFASIAEAGEHLLGVINDILDFSRIEAGKLRIDRQPLALVPTVENVVGLHSARAADKGLQLSVALAPDLPAWVTGDALRLAQILGNLLSNAIKFTAAGTVALRVERAPPGISFAVTDTGIGMDRDKLDQLFLPFEQGDAFITREYGGSGLGLAISRNLANLMDGDISVESRPGAGSRFTLRLPLPECAAPADRPDALPDQARPLAGLLLLAAEDVEINRLVLEDLLVHEGARVHFAENGREAVERLEQAAADTYDLVLMDVQMPVMDGLEATRRIRRLMPELPVLGVTAHALAEEREKCLAAGMLDVVTKPIDLKRLVQAIRRHARRAGGEAGPAAAPAAVPPAPTPGAARTPGAMPAGAMETPNGQVDWPALLARFNGRRDFIGKLARSLEESHADTPGKLAAAVAQGDRDALVFLVHRVKGISGNLEAHGLQAMALDIETGLKAGAAIDGDRLMDLTTGLEGLLAEMRSFAGGGA